MGAAREEGGGRARRGTGRGLRRCRRWDCGRGRDFAELRIHEEPIRPLGLSLRPPAPITLLSRSHRSADGTSTNSGPCRDVPHSMFGLKLAPTSVHSGSHLKLFQIHQPWLLLRRPASPLASLHRVPRPDDRYGHHVPAWSSWLNCERTASAFSLQLFWRRVTRSDAWRVYYISLFQ